MITTAEGNFRDSGIIGSPFKHHNAATQRLVTPNNPPKRPTLPFLETLSYKKPPQIKESKHPIGNAEAQELAWADETPSKEVR